jgi:hypothetical protein
MIKLPTMAELVKLPDKKLQELHYHYIDVLEAMSKHGDKRFAVKGILIGKQLKMCWEELVRRMNLLKPDARVSMHVLDSEKRRSHGQRKND